MICALQQKGSYMLLFKLFKTEMCASHCTEAGTEILFFFSLSQMTCLRYITYTWTLTIEAYLCLFPVIVAAYDDVERKQIPSSNTSL